MSSNSNASSNSKNHYQIDKANASKLKYFNNKKSPSKKDRTTSSIKITGGGPYNSLNQVLSNMTPNDELIQHKKKSDEQEGPKIIIGTSNIYDGNIGNSGYRSGETNPNNIGFTPN